MEPEITLSPCQFSTTITRDTLIPKIGEVILSKSIDKVYVGILLILSFSAKICGILAKTLIFGEKSL